MLLKAVCGACFFFLFCIFFPRLEINKKEFRYFNKNYIDEAAVSV